MTHVLALGGAGNMCRHAVRTLLAERPDVDRLTVADVDGRAAERFVADLEDDRVDALELDVTNEPALEAALEGVTLVMNTVGPFFEFGTTVLEASIDAGVDYVDICDDWEPTEASLALDEEARAAGMTAVVGFGASPGISNLLAMYAADQLETAEAVLTAWFTGGGGNGGNPSAASVHGIHMIAEPVPTFRDGERVFVDPFAERRSITFPGFGDYELYHVGHPEPVTLPAFLDAETVANLGGLFPPVVNDAYRELAGRLQSGELTTEDAIEELPALVNEVLSDAGYDPDNPPYGGGLAAVAVGELGSERVECTCALGSDLGGGMGGSTGVPLAIAASAVLDGEVETGVHPPEATMDPRTFFERLAPHCEEPYRALHVEYRSGE